MSHYPSMDPDSPHYSNDDPTWNEPRPPDEECGPIYRGLSCEYCHQATGAVRWRRLAEAILCQECWADVQEGMRYE